MELIVIQNTAKIEEDHFVADVADSHGSSIEDTKTD